MLRSDLDLGVWVCLHVCSPMLAASLMLHFGMAISYLSGAFAQKQADMVEDDDSNMKFSVALFQENVSSVINEASAL